MQLKENGTNNVYMRAFVSVDCVVFGFDGRSLNLLLVERAGEHGAKLGMKLPGSLIYQQEDTDEAAVRVLNELTGIRKMKLRQFKSFSAADRADDPNDVKWLEFEYHHDVDRLITVAYLALTKIDRKLNSVSKYRSAEWIPVEKIGKMPFDHNRIVNEALDEIGSWIVADPSIVFELLPRKFTAAELRALYEAVHRKKMDVRNFHKKIVSMDYIIPLEEKQTGVAHRAARYYRFDKIIYNKRKHSI